MNSITPAELALWQTTPFNFTLLDVRRDVARSKHGSAIAGATWHNPAQWLDWKDAIAEQAASHPSHPNSPSPVVLYCAHGHEISAGLTAALCAMGVDARSLKGGMTDWQAAGQPVVALA
jgi:thiosulfate sulfurtransferase